ncbi:MAG: GNAT family N-acetyltransferase [Frankiaceae bacterium]|nr:GNAT family N-acetyltransferase [Frankiaceae bacterium]
MDEPTPPTYHRMPLELALPAGEVLRPFGPGDLDQLVAVVNDNLGRLRPWMPWAQQPVSVESQREFLEGSVRNWEQGTDFVYGIFEGDTILGGTGLHTRRGARVLEIGYWLAAAAEGRGLVTAATRVLAEVAASYDEVGEVVICCDEGNVRSAAVPRRLGFTLSGVEQVEAQAAGETGWHEIWTMPTSVIRAGWAGLAG